MTGTAAGLTEEGRSTTTTMFTHPIRRSHQLAATILRDLPLQIVPGESAALAVWAALVAPAAWEVSAGLGEPVDREESAGPEGSVDRGALVGRAVSGGLGESAGLVELAGVRVHPTG